MEFFSLTCLTSTTSFNGTASLGGIATQDHQIVVEKCAAAAAASRDDVGRFLVVTTAATTAALLFFLFAVLEQRPSDTQAFARETFGHRNLKEQVSQVHAFVSPPTHMLSAGVRIVYS